MKLETQIKKWQDAGLIDEKAGRAILQYEEKQPEKSYILYGIVGIGVTALVCGLISIIAANWNVISDNVKLITYFLLQSGLGFGYLKTPQQRPILKTTFLWIFALSFFGGIGLVGQIYHLSSSLWKPLTFWLSLALLPTLLEQRKLLIHFWLMTLFFSCFLYIAEFNYHPIYFCSAAFIMTSIGINGLTRFIPLPINFQNLTLKYGVFMLLSSSSLLGNNAYSYSSAAAKTITENLNTTLSVLLLTAIGAVANACLRQPSLKITIKLLFTALCALIVIYLSLACYFPAIANAKVFGAVGFVAIWSIAAWIAALINAKRIYNFMTFVIAMRFIVMYFEIFGSLAATGFGLIISGVVILLIAHLWNRYRNFFLQWAQK